MTGAVTVGGCAGVTRERTFESWGPGSQSMPGVGWEGSACPGGSGQVTCGLALTDVVGTVTGKGPKRHLGEQ